MTEVQRRGIQKVKNLGTHKTAQATDTEDMDTQVDHSQQNARPGRIKTLEELRADIPTTLQWAIEEMTTPEDNGESTALDILTHKGEFVCDRSLKDLRRTAAALSLQPLDKDNIYFRNRTQGRTEEMSSRRAELGGILAVVLGWHLICERWRLKSGTVMVGCDNEAAVWNVFGYDDHSSKVAGFNLVRTIRHLIAQSPIKWK